MEKRGKSTQAPVRPIKSVEFTKHENTFQGHPKFFFKTWLQFQRLVHVIKRFAYSLCKKAQRGTFSFDRARIGRIMSDLIFVKRCKQIMSVHHKKPRSAGLSVLVYDRGLHPELFTVDARRARILGGLEVSMWLLANGGHLVAVSSGGKTVSELACFPSKALPDRGLIERLPCKGDKQYEKALGNHFQYYLALNEEHVTEALFDNSVTELLRLAEEQGG